MTAEAERSLRPSRLKWLATGMLVASAVAACTVNPSPESPIVPTAAAEIPADIPSGDAQQIQQSMNRLNAAAAGAVSDQQQVLHALVDPGLSAALDQCPPATTTLRFEPVYAGLRPSPGWTPSGGELSGTVYALPSLIRIYTGDRITGTDLTTLHFGVNSGEAFLTPLCIG